MPRDSEFSIYRLIVDLTPGTPSSFLRIHVKDQTGFQALRTVFEDQSPVPMASYRFEEWITAIEAVLYRQVAWKIAAHLPGLEDAYADPVSPTE